ncbi:hypothetical protein [uncultured Desulfuromonas sp.]|nr:hypothetical protein [uncultured Desulfuromonas sp.]
MKGSPPILKALWYERLYTICRYDNKMLILNQRGSQNIANLDTSFIVQ